MNTTTKLSAASSPLSCEVELSSNSEEPDPPRLDEIQKWLSSALSKLIDKQHSFPETIRTLQISIHVVDAAEGAALNSNYRKKNHATNVLSFSAESPPLEQELLLGDIVVCAPVIRHEAEQQNKSTKGHWAHMIIHGFLHLCGYDHTTEADAEIMEAMEICILKQLQFNNPYLINHIMPHKVAHKVSPKKPEEMINA